MAYVADYQHDVFVSYSHADNEVDEGDLPSRGWVSRFEQLFRRELRSYVGQDVAVSFDHRKSASTISEYMERVQSSACFLAVGSRTYIREEGVAIQEFREFRKANDDRKRIFIVERRSFDRAALGEDVATDVIFRKFFSSDEEGVDIEFDPDSPLFKVTTKKVASQVAERLRDISGRTLPSETLRAHARRESKSILLAHVTEDLLLQREELSSFLGGDVDLRPTSSFPGDGRSFEATYSQALEQSDIVVQLLSSSAGVPYPGMSQPYTQFQYQQAIRAGKEVIQWRSPTLDVKALSGAQRQMLEGPQVVVMGFEEFKKTVRERARQKAGQAPEVQSGSVFINADAKDEPYARLFSQAFSQANMAVAYADPAADAQASTDAQRRALTAHLSQCDVLVYVVKDAPMTWITNQIINYPVLTRQRSQPPKRTAICVDSPEMRNRIHAALPASANPRDYFVGDWRPERIASLVREVLA